MMDLNKIITFPESIKVAVEVARTVQIAPYQWGDITLEKLLLSRTVSLEKRGITWADREFAIIDLARIYSGYTDPRFLTGNTLYTFHENISKEWFAYYKAAFPDFKEWNHLFSTEKGVLNNQLVEDVIEATKIIQETPNILILKYQSLLT